MKFKSTNNERHKAMNLSEIKQALDNGECVKYFKSTNKVRLEGGKVISKCINSGFEKVLSNEDLDDCFI